MAITKKRLKELGADWGYFVSWANGQGVAVPAEIDMVKDTLFPEIRRQREQIKELKTSNKKLKNRLDCLSYNYDHDGK